MTKVKNTELVKLMQQALSEGWGYVWGLNGEKYTKEMAEKFKNNKRSAPDGKPETYWTVRCAKWYGKMCADCSGLIVWALRRLGAFTAAQDRGSASFKSTAAKSGTISTIPEVPGLAVWRSGHIGIYIGNGYVIEARGTDIGVVKTRLKDRDFTHWCAIKEVDYGDAFDVKTTEATTTARTIRLTSPYTSGDDVKQVQRKLAEAGCSPGSTDGVFGPQTEAAVKAFQKASGLAVVGYVGPKTRTKLGL